MAVQPATGSSTPTSFNWNLSPDFINGLKGISQFGQSQQSRQPPQPQGMFGSMPYQGPSSYTPGTSNTGPQTYDFSGISRGISGLQGASRYNPTQYQPYQFSNPGMNTVGSYGTSSPADIAKTYQTSFQAGASPIIAQGSEAMRGLTQGFGASGSLGGAAKAELMLKNAQQTGSNLQDLSKTLGSNIATEQLGEQSTARERDFAEEQQVRNAQYQTQLNNQMNQAAENFKAAGMSDDQARYYAQDAINRANQLTQYGFQLPQLQNQLNQSQEKSWQDFMNSLSGLAYG